MARLRKAARSRRMSLVRLGAAVILMSGVPSLAKCVPPSLESPDTKHYSTIHAIAFSPDGKLLGTAESASPSKWLDRHYALLLDAATGELIHKLRKDGSSVRDMAFSPDGKLLATGGTLCLWNVESGEEVRTYCYQQNGSSAQADAICFSPDGKTLVSANGAIWYWATYRNEELAFFEVHDRFRSDGLQDIAISPDGRILATAGDHLDAAICLWNLKKRKLFHKITPPNSKGRIRGIESIAFSPDGKMLASAAGTKMLCGYGTSRQDAPCIHFKVMHTTE